MANLKKSEKFSGVKGPLLTIIMDGVGIAPDNGANAVAAAHTPTLDRIMKEYPTLAIKAHGTAVGLPSDDDMGNSEVGHNALSAQVRSLLREQSSFLSLLKRELSLKLKPGASLPRALRTITERFISLVFSPTETFTLISTTSKLLLKTPKRTVLRA